MKNKARILVPVYCFSVIAHLLILKTTIANAGFSRNNIMEHRDYVAGSGKIDAVLDFKASYNGNFTILEWRTELSHPLDQFMIEVSNDEENYEIIAEVKNHKNVEGFKNYTYLDSRNLLRDSFYRLVQVGEDGDKVYSSVVMVKVNPLNQLRLFPVPTKNTLNIKGYFGAVSEMEISISDFNGNTYPVYNLIKVSDEHYTVDFSSLRSNNYLVKITSNGKTASFRVLKL